VPSRSVGVVIRTLNEAQHMARCLDTLRGQRGDHALDILVVDSGSSDDTLRIARERGARTIEIPPEEFHYSRTLNLGIEEVRGDIVLALSAHAIPVDDGWVRAMTTPFDDPEVAGVTSRQVPWPGAPFREAHRLAETFGTEPRTYAAGQRDVLFSNAASAIRRSVWRDDPFTLAAAEDLEWAARVVEQGWKIVYAPDACVFHSHDESPRALARRLIDLNRGGTLAVADRRLRHTLREAATYLYRDLRLIVGLREPLGAKLRHARDAAATAGYYLADFSKSGSTAEHRQRHA
jgi:GT2 family glycosyltransferase